MLDEKFLTELLGKEDVAVEDKVSQILSEKNADERGLVQKRDELLGAEKKLKEQIKSITDEKTGYETKISGLEEELKKASSEDHKQYYETQVKDLTEKFNAEIEQLKAENTALNTEKLNNLRDKTVADSIKNYNFVDGLKDGFVSLLMSKNDFKPKEIDGNVKFLNADNHTIDEVVKAFALSPEGKCYIKNPNMGGGAVGGSQNSGNVTKMTLSQFDNLTDAEKMDFSKKGGEVVD